MVKITGGLKFNLQDVAAVSIPISASHGEIPVEQILNIGSRNWGAEKITFNPF